jgi:hypothetical protein
MKSPTCKPSGSPSKMTSGKLPRSYKMSRAKITKHIEHLKKDMEELMNHWNLDEDNSTQFNEAIIANEISYLEMVWARDCKDETRMALAHQGETLGGAWSAINKEWKPRDILYCLRIPNSTPPPSRETPAAWWSFHEVITKPSRQKD